MRYEDTSGSVGNSGTPEARDDADTLAVGSNGPASGNVITGAGTTTGQAGADVPVNAHVVAIRGAGGTDTADAGQSLHVDGRYGALVMDEHGAYKYVADGHAPESFRDLFQYTLADSKGGRSVADLVITRGAEIKVSENAQRIVPGPDGVVTLPAGVNLSDVHVVGRDLVVDMPDGTQIVIVDGAVFVPQLVLGGVEVPSTNLAALMIESEQLNSGTGTPQSSGGNFAVDVPPLDPGVPLGDLIPPTELVFTLPRFEEIGQFIDRDPEAGAVSVQLDDDAKAGGNPGGTGDDPDSVNPAGFLPGSDGDGALTWDLLNGGAPLGFSYADGPNGSILVQQVQNGSTVTVLTITVNPATGAYTVTQNAAILHATGDNENNVSFVVNYTVTDSDGDSAIGTITVNVDDDTPTVTVTATSDANVILTTHDAATIGAASEAVSTTANFSGVFTGTTVSPGADGAGAGTTSGYALSTTGGASGLTQHGVAINLYSVGGVIVGSTATTSAGITAANTVFTVSTTNTGIVTLTQFSQIDHSNADPSPTGSPFTDHIISLTDGSITLTRSETVVDKDGDSVTGSASVGIGANLRFVDDGPTISLADRGEPSLTVDETDLGTNATASFAANFSANFGADGPAAAGSITYALGINAGATGLVDVATGLPIVLVNNAGVIEGHVGTAAGALAFTVSVNAAGDVTLDQIRALSHPNASNPDDSVSLAADNLVTLTATAHDFDGDTASQTLNIAQNLHFEDDGPSISASANQPSLTVDETSLAANATASFASVFTPLFGADGAGSVTYALGITGGNGVASGLTDVATGLSIVLVNNAGVVEGHVGNTAGALAFTVSIDGSGNVTLDQLRAVTHPDTTNPDDSVTLSADNLVTVTATVTDRDGDQASATANIGQNLNFEDDGPSITAAGTQPQLTVDETVLATNATASFAGVFTPVFGADGAGTVSYALTITGGNGVASGLIDVATGSAIVLVNNAGVIEGHVGTAAGALAFTVSVDGSGNVTLDQIRALQHPNPANPDDSITLANDNLVVLNATVTDRDGDQASATANIGQNLNFEDDGPSISASVEQPSLTVDETVLATNATTSFAGVFSPVFGADGAGTVTYALGITGGNGVASGLTDVATGLSIVLVNNAGVIEGHVGTAAGALAFTVTADGSGNVTLDQIRAVVHPNTANPDDSVTLANDNLVTLTATVTDRDGDQATAIANIGQNLNFEDDGPSIVATQTEPVLIVDETVLATNASASFAGAFISSFGADGAGAVTYALGLNSALTNLFDTATGQPIVLVNNAGVIEGHVGNVAGPLALTISVDANSGVVTLDQIRAVVHGDPTNPNDSVSLALDSAVTLTATVTDRDGDHQSAVANIGQNFQFLDDGPSITTSGTEASLTVDETNLAANATASFATAFTPVFGADGPGTPSVTYGLSITGSNGVASGLIDVATGSPIVLVNNAGVIEGHVGTAAGALAFTVSVNAAGDVTLDQIRALQHPNPANPDDSVTLANDNLVVLTATAHDGDGDTASANLNIGQNFNFEDDGPAINANGQQPSLTVDETVLATNATASFAGVFSPVFGADGAGTVTYALGITGGNGVASGLTDVATGLSIVLVNNGGVIEGHVGTAAGALAFTVTADGSGNVTLDQIRSVVHPNTANPDDSVTLANDNLVVLTATVTDRDGDQASATANIGQNLNFEDDGPSISLSGQEASLTVDETVLATNATGNFATAFTPLFGADGAGTVTYALNVLSAGANSGLVDTATGQPIVLVKNGVVVEGHVGNAAGALAFTVSVDASGNVTLDQIRAVVHPNTLNPDDSVTLSADNLVSLTATVTDRDGDQQSATLNIGQNLNFEDDGPSVTLSGTEPTLTVDETSLAANAGPTSFASAFLPVFGADGAGTTSYALAITGGNGTNSGLLDTATGSAIVLVNNAGVIEGHVGNAAGALAFTVTTDASGNVTLDQIRAIVHSPNTGPNQSATLSADNLITLTATVTDRDGDTATATLNIGQNLVFLDDAPSATGESDNVGSGLSTATGNVITGVDVAVGADANGTDGVADSPGADGFGSITLLVANGNADSDNSSAGGGFIVDGLYGQLVMQANGDYVYTRGPGSPGNVNETFNYTYQDRDGDTATATLTISITDSTPSATAASVVIDDDDVVGANGNPGTPAVNDDAPSNATGNLTGTGGDGDLDFYFSATQTIPGFTTVLDNSVVGQQTLQISQNGTLVVTIVLTNETGAYTVTENAPIVHAAGNLENNTTLGVSFFAQDVDGSPSPAATMSISVDDDTPVVTLATVTEPQLTVDETVLATNAGPTSFGVLFNQSFGADGPAAAGSSTWALGINAGSTGLIDVATGQAIVLFNNGGVVEGHVGSTGGALAFTVTVDGSGNVTLDQIRALQHPNASNPDDSVTLAADNLVTLTHTITDRDGDSASATANIGQNLNFEDDGPSIGAGGTQPQLTVDETILATNATASFAAVFTPLYGADNAGTVTYALTITGANGVASGLTDVATGSSIVLVNNAGVIEGHVATAAGALAFTVTVDGSGNVTLDQIRAVQHPNTANPDDSVTLANDNLVVLTATVTDRDGDQASAAANIGQNLNFEDDGPSITANGTQPSLTVDETVLTTNASADFSGVFAPLYGADGAGTVAYALGITGGNGTASGLLDVATGQSIVLVNNAGVIEGHVGTQAGLLAFTVTADGSGNVTLDQIRAVVHPNTANPDDSVTLANDNLITLTATVTDRDGDQASATANIGQNLNFEDDGPSATIVETGQGVSIDESVGIQSLDSNDTTNAGIIALFAGVTNTGTDTDLPQYATNASAVVAATGSSYGADGAGTTAFSLNVSSAGVDSGLNTTAGSDIFLYKEGNLIVGRVGSQAGPAAFAIAIDAVTGQVSMVEYLSIQHSNASNPDDSVSIADGALQAVVTVTDRDGDPATSTPTNIGNLISFQDSGPVMTGASNINILNGSADMAHTGTFAFSLGADGAPTSNDVISLVTGSATVNSAAVTNYTLTAGAETATTATYTFSFDYVTGPSTTAHETGTLTFDKAAGTYTVDLDQTIQGFTTIVQTATGTLFQGYEPGTSTPDGSQPAVSVTQVAPNMFVQFTGVAEPSSGTGANNLRTVDISTTTGVTSNVDDTGADAAAWTAGELFDQDSTWVSTSNDANGVSGDTIQGGEVLDFNLYTSNPTGTLGLEPTASATTMFLKFDGIGSGEDMIVILKLYDATTDTYTTRAVMVQNADIQHGPGVGPGLFSAITLDQNDGLVIIESNDYNAAGEHWVIVGAQIAGSDEGITGNAINLNGAIGAGGGSNVTGSLQPFSTDVNDGPFKISSIGFLTQTTTAQPADLTFNVTIQDGDGDTVSQTIHATVSAAADSSTPIVLAPAVTTVSQTPLSSKSTALVSDTHQMTQQTTTNSNAILMGAFAAAGLAASDSLAASTMQTNLNSSVSSLATAAYHTQSLAPIALDAMHGSHGIDAMPSLSFGHGFGLAEAAAIHAAPEQFAARGLAGLAGEAHQQPEHAAFLQGTQAPAHDQVASMAAGAGGGMPAAQQLAALASGGVAGAQHNQVVSQVLADALHGGGSVAGIETALGSLPGHGGGTGALEALASHNGWAVSNGDNTGYAGFTAAHAGFTMEAMMVHVDAVQPHA